MKYGRKIKKSNGVQSDVCHLEFVTLKPQLQADHCLNMLKGADLNKQRRLFGIQPTRRIGEMKLIIFLIFHL